MKKNAASINLIVTVTKMLIDCMIIPAKKLNDAEQDTISKKKRGRPKCFNENQALEKAMYLFWQHGYEATTIHDITQALGITAPSLYCSFGDKEALFSKSIDYYLSHEACTLNDLLSQAITAKVAFEQYLYEHIRQLTQSGKPKGCMLVIAAISGSEQTKLVQLKLREKRMAIKQQLLARLKQGVLAKDLAVTAPLTLMVEFYYTIIQGLSIQARDEVPPDQLRKVALSAMNQWDLLEKG